MQGAVRTLRFLSLLSLLCAASSHAGTFYMCKDANGRTFTSDRPISECANQPLREYGSNGVLKREIAAPLTPEQKRELALQEQQRQEELAAIEEQKRSDRALLARYRSENDIAVARERACAARNEQIAQQKNELAAAEKEWQAVQAAVDARQDKGTVPAAMRDKLAKSLETVRLHKAALRDNEIALAQINAKYDAVLRRYRKIVGQSSATESASR